MNLFTKRNLTFILPLLFLLISTQINAQLIVTSGTGLSPQQLVQNTLIGGGVTVSNVTYCGSSGFITFNNIGSFATGTPTGLGLSSGLILASGGVVGAVGPNNSDSYTLAVSPSTPDESDPDLLTLVPSGTTLHDAAVLEFDFIPISDTIRFRYVFGSEEYPEFVGEFDDVFGFFITGQNPTGAAYVKQNIALVPGTTTAISIDNVNDGDANTGPCENCQYYINNEGGQINVQADGLTTVLTAWAHVVPCTSYHIKLAIADANDRVYDSWVWLEANSFSSNGTSFTTSFSNPNAIPVAIAGCNNEIIKFIKSQVSVDTTWMVIDSIYGTAVNGVDFPLISDSIAILPGQTSATVTVAPYSSIAPGPNKYVIIKFNTTICGADSIYIPIMQYTPLHITTSNDTSICQASPPQSTVSLKGYASGGGSYSYIYSWSPAIGLNNPNIANPIATPSINLTLPTPQYIQYMLTLTDSTGCPGDTSSVLVTLNSYPSISFDASPTSGCEPINVTFTNGTSPTSTYIWNFGDNSPTDTTTNPTHTYNSTGSPFTVTLDATTIAGSCKSSFTATNYINVYPQPHADFTWSPNIGALSNPVIYFTNTTTPINSTFINSWNFGDGDTSNLQNPSHLYTSASTFDVVLIVTGDHGCADTIIHYVQIVDDSLVFPNIITPNGDKINDNFVIKGLEKGGYPENRLVIYNRWGKKVYDSNNYQNGSFDGKGFPDGVYYYIFTAKGVIKEFIYQSSLEILR